MRHALIIAACAAALVACEEEEAPPPRYSFTFSATTDGQPLEGVTISVNDDPKGDTNGEGIFRQDLTGPEGAPISVNASCPEGYHLVGGAQSHTLRRVASLDPAVTNRGIQVSFECAPDYREAVVVVRTHDQTDLPVFLDGSEVTRTDESGAAHLYVRMQPNTSFEVRIATASNERLRPQEPSRSFTIPNRDAVFVFDQEFEEERPPRRVRRVRRAAPAAPRLPIRIGGR
ncbi:MAG: hypothetical protein VYE22_06045 [Myxococcota bacterium]|nr:hypothetical protein [Myxococcota bacterium]